MKVWLRNLHVSRIECVETTLNRDCDGIEYRASYTDGTRTVYLQYTAGVNSCGEYSGATKVTGEQVDFQLVTAAVEALHDLISQINGVVGAIHDADN